MYQWFTSKTRTAVQRTDVQKVDELIASEKKHIKILGDQQKKIDEMFAKRDTDRAKNQCIDQQSPIESRCSGTPSTPRTRSSK